MVEQSFSVKNDAIYRRLGHAYSILNAIDE